MKEQVSLKKEVLKNITFDSTKKILQYRKNFHKENAVTGEKRFIENFSITKKEFDKILNEISIFLSKTDYYFGEAEIEAFCTISLDDVKTANELHAAVCKNYYACRPKMISEWRHKNLLNKLDTGINHLPEDYSAKTIPELEDIANEFNEIYSTLCREILEVIYQYIDNHEIEFGESTKLYKVLEALSEKFLN